MLLFGFDIHYVLHTSVIIYVNQQHKKISGTFNFFKDVGPFSQVAHLSYFILSENEVSSSVK